MNTNRHWLVPTSLIALSLLPVAAGTARLVELAGHAPVTPDNARFFASPIPVVLHIPAVTIFALVGALQFAPSLRRRTWHRRTGRIVMPAGLVAAITGLWMAVYYDLPPADNNLLEAFRLLAGSGMAASLNISFRAIRRRDIPTHRAWMMRGYALGLGAGTQTLTLLLGFAAVGTPTPNQRALLMAAAWLINLATAEFFIHARPALLPKQRQPLRKAPEPPQHQTAAAPERVHRVVL